MRIEHIKKFVGLPVIVQLKDAMALGAPRGPLQPVPCCNEQGHTLCKDGSVATDATRPEELAMRPSWPIQVHREGDGQHAPPAPTFRYAIENAVLVYEEDPESDLSIEEDEVRGLVRITYSLDQASIMELLIEPESIVGLTRVMHVAEPQAQSRLVQPGN